MVGAFTTQICVGQFDVQLTLGDFRFVLQSPIRVLKSGVDIGGWEPSKWPDAAFYDLMNVEVTGSSFKDHETLSIQFEGGLELLLREDPGPHESMQIIVGKNPGTVYIV